MSRFHNALALLFILASLLPSSASAQIVPQGTVTEEDPRFEKIVLIVNGEEPLKSRLIAAMNKQFEAIPQVELIVFKTRWPNFDPQWSITMNVAEAIDPAGNGNGDFILATAYSNPISITDRDKVMNELLKYGCAPKKTIEAALGGYAKAVIDLKAMLVSNGRIADGFDGAAREIVDIFRNNYFPADARAHRLRRPLPPGVPPAPVVAPTRKKTKT